MTDRIALLAALVQRKWRSVTSRTALGEPDWIIQQESEEWAAASLLLELAQDAAAEQARALCGVLRADGAPCTLAPQHLGKRHSYCGSEFEQEDESGFTTLAPDHWGTK